MTECNETLFPFEAHFSRQVVAQFEGSWLTTEGGSLLLRQADRKIGLLRRVARCFTDYRQPERIEHPLEEMLAQRIYGLALGYEDLNDHEQLRQDPLLAVLAGKRDWGEPLAGKSTLNRLELTAVGSPAAERYNKISYCSEALDELPAYVFVVAGNQRLLPTIGRAMHQAKQEHQRTGKSARVFCEFAYRTKKSWSRARRVIAKAEQIEGKENPRYLVTSLGAQDWPVQKLYEQLYCARGEMENRIKEQLSLFADRLSTETLRANQLGLDFSSLAHVLTEALRLSG